MAKVKMAYNTWPKCSTHNSSDDDFFEEINREELELSAEDGKKHFNNFFENVDEAIYKGNNISKTKLKKK